MTSAENRHRQPAGVSTGGQFAPETKSESTVGLSAAPARSPFPTAQEMAPEWKAASGLTFGTPAGEHDSVLEGAVRQGPGKWVLSYTTQAGETQIEGQGPVRGRVAYTIDDYYGLIAIDVDSPTTGQHHQNIGTVAGFGDFYGGELLQGVSGIEYPHEWAEDAENRLWANPNWTPAPADFPDNPC